MTIVRKMLVATGTVAAITAGAQAQLHVFSPIATLNEPQAVGTGTTLYNLGGTFLSYNLGTAPTGTYSNYLVVVDWASSGAGNQWSSEARHALMNQASTSLTTTPGGSGFVRYGPTSGTFTTGTSAVGGSASATTNRTIFWTGTMATTGTSAFSGGNMWLGAAQSFGGGTGTAINAQWNNVRVILNYSSFSTGVINNVTTLSATTALPTPSTFTDMGLLSPGRVSATNLSAPAGSFAWVRFEIGSNVDNALGSLLDLDTEGSGGTNDTEISLFRYNPITNQLDLLGPASTGYSTTGAYADDDSGSGNFSQLSFGSTNTTAPVPGGARPYGVPSGGSAYDGRDGSLAAGIYFVAFGHFNGGFSTTASTVTLSSTSGLTDNGGGNFFFGTTNEQLSVAAGTWLNPTTAVTGQLNIAFVPTPGAAALLGLGALAAGRRRR